MILPSGRRQFYFPCSASRFQAAQTRHLRQNGVEPSDRRETETPCGRFFAKRLDSNGLRFVVFFVDAAAGIFIDGERLRLEERFS